MHFTNEVGFNCLIASFQLMGQYKLKTGRNPTNSTGMFCEIEETLLFLTEESERHGVDMSTILNTRNNEGATLFNWATHYSEKIALALLERNVTVNTVTSDFGTPWFKVS